MVRDAYRLQIPQQRFKRVVALEENEVCGLTCGVLAGYLRSQCQRGKSVPD